MRTKLLLFICCIIFSNSYSQVSFQTKDLTTQAEGAGSVHVGDLNGDGELDVLFSASLDDKIAFFTSTDGGENFNLEQTISTEANQVQEVQAVDLDGDGDMDVLTSLYLEGKVLWYENTDGNGNFSAANIITEDADGAISVYAADMDKDGDMDVISASFFENRIAWFENTNGLGSFGPPKTITTNASEAYSVYAADIDGDGDMDVLSASSLDNKIAWYENTSGLGFFGSQKTITTDATEATSVHAADIDGDGDMDVLSTSFGDDKIAWYENRDGDGDFGSQKIISTDVDAPYSVFAADIDGDGDMDVLSASAADSKIAWYENTNGLGNFGSQNTITTNAIGAVSVFAVDIDEDGDMDVLSASYTDDKIALYENLNTVSIEENYEQHFSIYPVPTTDAINIKSKLTIAQVEIYNVLGQLELTFSTKDRIDVSNLNRGHYFIKVKFDNGSCRIRKVGVY